MKLLQEQPNAIRTMHLFAGVGGGLLADLILGHTPVVAVEWAPYACQILRERAAEGWFPGLRVHEGDVSLFDPSEYTGVVDCIHAGFPCQDISVAGKQAGVGEGTRSGLYREVLRIAGVVRPRQLFLENVAAIKSNGLETVLKDLAELGYDCRWLCIRASDVGAPHHRDRWFLLANSGGLRWDDRINHREERRIQVHGQRDDPKVQPKRNKRVDRVGEIGEVLANTKSQRARNVCENDRAQRGEINAPDNTSGIGSRVNRSTHREFTQALANTECQRLQGQGEYVNAEYSTQESDWQTTESWDGSRPEFWSIESNVGRVANGVPNRVHRLKGLGNAQVPLQAATAYRLLGGA